MSDRALVRNILERGADVNAQWTKVGTTALMLAADFGLTDIVSMLLSRDADPNKVDCNRWTALMMAARKEHWQITNLLLDSGAHPDMTNIDGSTAL